MSRESGQVEEEGERIRGEGGEREEKRRALKF